MTNKQRQEQLHRWYLQALEWKDSDDVVLRHYHDTYVRRTTVADAIDDLLEPDPWWFA